MTNTYDKQANSFTPAMAAAAFSHEALDEAYCRAWVIARLHPGDPRCPECGSVIQVARVLSSFYAGRRCACKACKRMFTAKSETFLQDMKISYRQVFFLAALAGFKSSGLDTSCIASAINISPGTVRLWEKRFKLFND